MEAKTTTTSKFNVKGMHCASCAISIEKELNKIDGIEKAQVNVATETVEVIHSEQSPIDISAINQNLSKLGYSLESKQLPKKLAEPMHEDHGAKHDHHISRETVLASSIITIVAIILMLLGFFVELSENTAEFIHHLFPLLALYMMLVPGSQYIFALARYIRYGHANMDTLIGLGTISAFLYSFAITAFEVPLAPYLDVHAHYYDTTVVIIGFITLGKYLETLSKNKTKKSLESLISLQAKTAFTKRDTDFVEIPIDDINVGDLILVKAGSKIPVDGTVETESPEIDESSITGESMPVTKTTGDRVFAGTMNTSIPFTFKAVKLGKDTLLSHIVNMVEEAQNSKAPIQKLADTISARFVPTVLVIAIVSLLSWLLIGSQYYNFDFAIAKAMSSFIGVLIIACPCALGLATPIALITGIGKSAKNGILIKNANALELLHKADTLVIDKTGTLTEGKPKFNSIRILTNDKDYNDNKVIEIVASLEINSEHPIATAIIDEASARKLTLPESRNTKVYRGMGIEGIVGDKKYLVGNLPMMRQFGIDMENSGNNIGTHLYLADEKTTIAVITISDKLRQAAQNAILSLKNNSIDIIMATGDNTATAKQIANEAGITKIKSQLLPSDKISLVKELQDSGKVVVVAGDGINDAPALAQADISIAMSTGADVAIEASDVTILKGDISKIGKAIDISRKTMRIIKQNLFWAFSYNLIGIPLASGLFYPLFGLSLSPEFSAIAMAFSSIAVVLNALRLYR